MPRTRSDRRRRTNSSRPAEVDGERPRRRTYGKSDPIDALAVARAVLREPDLPEARLDGTARELRLLADYHEELVAERTRIIARLRWHLDELDPGWKVPTKMDRTSSVDKVRAHLLNSSGVVAELAARLVEHRRRLAVEIDELNGDICTGSFVVGDS
ncbi:transposase [Rhodococcus sp. NPDC057014]|uniref:IS110 family transposase n=1 Tax=Rhodococcus sp. NPDC057014 TaxID=3346000 RepID=UPI003627DA92